MMFWAVSARRARNPGSSLLWPTLRTPSRRLSRRFERRRFFSVRRHARGDDEAMAFEGVLRWPEEAYWLGENEARHPRSSRQILAGLAALADSERYAARGCGEGRILSGPVSSLLLTDAQAEIHFTFRMTSYGYPDAG